MAKNDEKVAKNDDKIKVLLNAVEEQKAKLGTKPKASWNTNGVFQHRDGTHFNLNTVKDPQVLVEALATLIERETAVKDAAKRLGFAAKPFVYNGYSVADWEADFKKRTEVVAWEERKIKLEATQAKLNQLVSEEARTEMELSDIEKLLG